MQQYYRPDSTTSRIEALLDRVAALNDGNSSSADNNANPDNTNTSVDDTSNPPTLEQFLEEEGKFPTFPPLLAATFTIILFFLTQLSILRRHPS